MSAPGRAITSGSTALAAMSSRRENRGPFVSIILSFFPTRSFRARSKLDPHQEVEHRRIVNRCRIAGSGRVYPEQARLNVSPSGELR